MNKVCVVVGVGPGLGAAVAKKFAKEGFAMGLIARTMDNMKTVEEEIKTQFSGKVLSVIADTTVEDDMKKAFSTIKGTFGPVNVPIYTAGVFKMASILDTSVSEFEKSWRVNCLGGFIAAKQVLPDMVEAKSGTILFSGATASLRSAANFVNLAVGKFGLRAVAQSMAREFGPQGIHVANVNIDGIIDTPNVRKMMKNLKDEQLMQPEHIAETYWHLHNQHSSTWTQELDIRPFGEKF